MCLCFLNRVIESYVPQYNALGLPKFKCNCGRLANSNLPAIMENGRHSFVVKKSKTFIDGCTIWNKDAGNDSHSTLLQLRNVEAKRFERTGGDGIYTTQSRRRGLLLMFTCIDFKNDIKEKRYGAEVDAKNLQYLFSEIGFKVKSYQDQDFSEQKIREILKKESSTASKYECVFVVVSSHGGESFGANDNDIYCSDGKTIRVSEIIDCFNNEKRRELAEIPKVFIFQLCRGKKNDYVKYDGHSSNKVNALQEVLDAKEASVVLPPRGHHVASASKSLPPRGNQSRIYVTDSEILQPCARDFMRTSSWKVEPKAMPLYTHILVLQSTLPGYVSRRDPTSGSWFIQVLCEVFAEHAWNTEIEALFRMVDKLMQERYNIQKSSRESRGFNHRLFLHPGLFKNV